MPQHEVEVILSRQLASYLATPIFIVDPSGNLVYYNEPAETILGCRFDETGEMSASAWSTIFTPIDYDGTSVLPESLPLFMALTEQRPCHRDFFICGLDGIQRHIEVVAFPLTGQAQRDLGAIAIFWELEDEEREA